MQRVSSRPASLAAFIALTAMPACGPRRPPMIGGAYPIAGAAPIRAPAGSVADPRSADGTTTISDPDQVVVMPIPGAPDEPRLYENPFDATLDAAERDAKPAARAVLASARQMIGHGDIVVGSCWDFVSAVYKRAAPYGHQKTIFASSKRGPYASAKLFEPGDWLYILHNTGGEHSVIFVRWMSPGARHALIADYVGGKRVRPPEYRTIDLPRVYNVMRLTE